MANDIISLANEIATEKENIRQAINTAGVSCPEDTPLKDYAGKISSIQKRIDGAGTDIFYKDTDDALTQETTSYTVASNYAVVSGSGLSGYENLETVNMPNVTAVLDSAFAGNKKLNAINAPLCKYYGASALSGTGISGSYTNDVAEYYGNACFMNNTALTAVSLPSALYLGQNCLKGCNKVKTINIPKVKEIGAYCFKNFANNVYDDSATLQTWTLSAPMLEKVGMFGVNSNNALLSVDLPKVTYIGDFAFNVCNNLASINIPAVKSIGQYAFNLSSAKDFDTDLLIPSCEKVGAYAFAGRYFPKITLKDGCYVDNYSFSKSVSNSTLKQVVGKISYAGDYAFYYNTELADIDLSYCTYLGANSFAYTKLTIIDLSACDFIGENAFNSSYMSYTKVWIPSTITTIKAYAFSNTNRLQFYTDVADSSSRPSGWASGAFPSNITWYYGSTYEDFLDA